MSSSDFSAKLAQSFASYLAPAVARRLFSDPASCSAPHIERLEAAVLFADVTGFTDLLERLSASDPHGTEELTLLLNTYFSRMIGLLEAQGGEVVQFSGDALTAVFLCDRDNDPAAEPELRLAHSVRCAWQAASDMQRSMFEFADVPTSLGSISLDMKCTIGAGEMYGLSVGGVGDHWQYVMGGDPLVQVATAAAARDRGPITLSPEAAAVQAEEPFRPAPQPPQDWSSAGPESVQALRSHVPDIVTHRLLAGQGSWLAELRSMTILFMGIGGLEYDGPHALDQVQRWVESCQQHVYRYEGSLNKLLVDDKGTIGIALFGAPPRSHEDDALRALRCAMELQQLAKEQNLALSVGITTGQVFAGPVGSDTRREYTVIGDTVNLAARLMQEAGPDGIRCDFNSYHATRDNIDWHELPPQTVKGRTAAVRIYRPVGVQQVRAKPAEMRPLFGRSAELRQLRTVFDRFMDGRLQVVCLEGEAGIGKSHLANTLVQWCREAGLVSLGGNGDALERQTPYYAWRRIFRTYFNLDESGASRDAQTRVRERLAEIAPELSARESLLNDLLGLDIPETLLTSNFVPRLRQASLTALLVGLLENWAMERPLLLVLEDAQWLDSLSFRLALQVARSLVDLPVLLLLVSRPIPDLDTDHPYAELIRYSATQLLQMEELEMADTVKLVAAEMGVDELPVEIANFLTHRATGNPFVAQELARSLASSQAVRIVNRQCMLVGHLSGLQVPDTLHGLALSRIDRLPPLEQLTLKVAAVIGRTFGFATVLQVLSDRDDADQLQAVVDRLIEHELLQPLESPTGLRSHRFKQALFQEVTYGTLLKAQRRELHEKIASWYELSSSADLYPLLAHHWRMAELPQRELGYAVLAVHKLAADYANSEALTFLDRALDLTNDNETQYELLTLRLEIHGRVGNRQAQETDLRRLQALIQSVGDDERQAAVANLWADYYRNISDYDSALVALKAGLSAARRAQDTTGEAKSLTLQGQVLEHRGAYKEARAYFQQSLTLYQELGDRQGEANNLSRLSAISRYLGDNVTAKTYGRAALDIRRQEGDRAREAVSLINLGLISMELGETAAATTYREEALAIAQAIGDRASEALSLSVIGQGHLNKGDYAAAQRALQQALRLYQVMGERRSAADCLNLLGMVWRDVGNERNAQRSFEEALAIQEEIGSHSFMAYSHLNVGLVNLQFNPAVTRVCYQKALESAQETGNRDAEAYAYTYRAGMYEQMGKWEAAATDYTAALEIRRELHAEAAAVEDTAGLARIALTTGQLELARSHAHFCLAFLDEKGSEGMEFPLQVYLTCYDVFYAVGDESTAQRVLADAHQLLMERAEATSDPVMRAGLLTNVATNQRLLQEWHERVPG